MSPFQRRILVLLCVVAVSCARVDTRSAFERWVAADAARGEAFARFEAALTSEGVSGVVPNYQLWRVDQLRRECAKAGFVAPPEADWANIVATLRILRDHVVPVLGPLEVVSAYRDPDFNTCVRGASRSAHMSFHALDLVPVDRTVTRERLIAALCPIHAREGAHLRMGLGIYQGWRFHVDARATAAGARTIAGRRFRVPPMPRNRRAVLEPGLLSAYANAAMSWGRRFASLFCRKPRPIFCLLRAAEVRPGTGRGR